MSLKSHTIKARLVGSPQAEDHPRTTRAASLLCILMRSAPVEPCDTAEIAAAVSWSSLSLGTTKTLTHWPSSSSSQLHVTALGDIGKGELSIRKNSPAKAGLSLACLLPSNGWVVSFPQFAARSTEDGVAPPSRLRCDGCHKNALLKEGRER